FEAHLRLMMDLVVLAFQTDTTRVVTLMYGNAGSNRTYPALGVKDGHHAISHHRNKPELLERLQKIDRYHAEQFAYLVKRLRTVREGEGTLLDQCMVLYGGGLADGNAHDHGNLPIVLAGRAGGTIRPGRHVRTPRETPLNNL